MYSITRIYTRWAYICFYIINVHNTNVCMHTHILMYNFYYLIKPNTSQGIYHP